MLSNRDEPLQPKHIVVSFTVSFTHQQLSRGKQGNDFWYPSHQSRRSLLVVHVFTSHTALTGLSAPIWLTAAREAQQRDRPSCAGLDWVWQVTDTKENLYISPQPNNQWKDKKRQRFFKHCSEESGRLKAIALHLQLPLCLSFRVCFEGTVWCDVTPS